VLWPASLSEARLHQRPRCPVVLLAPSAARRDVSVLLIDQPQESACTGVPFDGYCPFGWNPNP
jgi:hypothetical protein